jgi:ribonucleoside-triphosphate reductase
MATFPDQPAEFRPGDEGLFDQQLSLPLAFSGLPLPFRSIRKRDGREEPYDERKIAASILAAGEEEPNWDHDLARNLASAVTIYLMKNLAGGVPTVDEVSDAVERVLIQMAHAPAALAYARRRDRRARVRRLREGDLGGLLAELDEARATREALGAHPAGSLFVRTSTEALIAWDRDKIVAALQRETGLDRGKAELVALEVEDQIRGAGLHSLTAALVRELVDARLLAHGLGEHSARHRRLGVPLYDAARIIRGLSGETLGKDPAATDAALARAVKKEYALSEVFSPAVVEAHLRGTLHVHHLDRVDRLLRHTARLDMLARHGLMPLEKTALAAPARQPEALLAQMLRASETLQHFFAEDLLWDAVNVYFAPFLLDRNAPDIRRFAQMLVYEFAYRALAGTGARPEIAVHWELPPALARLDAQGPAGTRMSRTYGALGATAKLVTRALIEVFTESARDGLRFPAPQLLVVLGPEAESTQEEALRLLGGLLASGAACHVRFDRGAWAAPPLMQQVSINLPHLALACGSAVRLLEALEDRIAVAAQAHAEKRAFVEALLDAEGYGPLGALAADSSAAQVAVERLCGVVALDGLHECAQALYGAPMHASEEIAAFSAGLLEHARACLHREERRHRIALALGANADVAVSQRFATLDLHGYPRSAAALVKTTSKEPSLHYTPGVQLDAAAPCSAQDRLRIEGRLHALLDLPAFTVLRAGDAGPDAETIAGLLAQAWHDTTAGGIRFN